MERLSPAANKMDVSVRVWVECESEYECGKATPQAVRKFHVNGWQVKAVHTTL